MLGLLILAHAPLATALRAVAGHAFPEALDGVLAVDVPPEMGADELEAKVRALLLRTGAGQVLILSDVVGATPCNVAQRVADGVNIRVVAGVNVPMLWRALCYAKEPLDAVVSRAMMGATQGVMQVAIQKPQQQTQVPGAHDSRHSHHQQ